MASVNSKIKAALADLVNGNIFAMSLPPEKDPSEFIVYNMELGTPDDYGDDEDHEWITHMQVHWYAKGRVNYDSIHIVPKIRNRLKTAGFTISGVEPVGYDADLGTAKNGTGYTHICVLCNIPEDDPYGES